jgi:hypothetical protein
MQSSLTINTLVIFNNSRIRKVCRLVWAPNDVVSGALTIELRHKICNTEKTGALFTIFTTTTIFCGRISGLSGNRVTLK